MNHTRSARSRTLVPAWLLAAAVASPALAQFDNHHFMQIEQVIGGVNGDISAQAIQLRMRQNNQGVVNGSRVAVWNASGGISIVLVAFDRNVTNARAGDRILIATPNFSNYTTPPAVPDFVMTNLFTNVGAGRLVFETGPTIWWSLAWGGAGYTGSNMGSTTNDLDGNFGPPFAGPMPSTATEALLFRGAANAFSTTNAADYALTVLSPVFENNSRVQFTLAPPPCYADCDTGTGPGVLDIFDFLCFQNRYDAGDPYACDCDTGTGLGVCDIFDFLCFQNAYDAGCP